MPDGPRYDDDFYAWTKYQADVLREMRTDDNRFDRDNVVEEIESLGASQRAAAQSQITRILEHFLKLAHSPASDPRYGWMGSIVEGRAALDDLITETLRSDVGGDLRAPLPAMRDAGPNSACSSMARQKRLRRCRSPAPIRSTTYCATSGIRSPRNDP